MGTAPRRPTHEMKAISLRAKRMGARHNQTDSGRAMSMSTSEMPSAGQSVSSNRVGVTSRPSNRNMPAWDSQA